jgi:hypothetical protein
LVGFRLTEPPEVNRRKLLPGELEPDQETLKERLMELQLEDDAEIDQLLNDAIDPFIEYEEENPDGSDQAITKFLHEFKDLQAQQVEIEKAEKQRQVVVEAHHEHKADSDEEVD